MRRLPLLLLTLALLSACRQAQVPPTYTDSKSLPDIYPDYTNVTVPANIAPLRFQLMSQADDVVTRFTGGGSEIVCGGRKAMPDEDEWRDMVGKCNNADITVEVYAEKDGQWTRFKPFAIHVSADPIDPWLSYRLISPSYVAFEELTISQRCLENFDESIVYDNMLCSTEAEGQCINCHNYQRGNPNKMQFHARLANGDWQGAERDLGIYGGATSLPHSYTGQARVLAKHESGNLGSAHVSYGLPRTDGVDVGKYSFITKGGHGGSVGEFLRWAGTQSGLGKQLHDKFQALTGGDWNKLDSKEFWKSKGGQAAWQEMVKSNPEAFERLEDSFWLPRLERQFSKLRPEVQQAIQADKTGALREMALSTLNQHKTAIKILNDNFDPNPETYIRNVYADRAQPARFAATGDPGIGQRRMRQEVQDVLGIFRGQASAPASVSSPGSQKRPETSMSEAAQSIGDTASSWLTPQQRHAFAARIQAERNRQQQLADLDRRDKAEFAMQGRQIAAQLKGKSLLERNEYFTEHNTRPEVQKIAVQLLDNNIATSPVALSQAKDDIAQGASLTDISANYGALISAKDMQELRTFAQSEDKKRQHKKLSAFMAEMVAKSGLDMKDEDDKAYVLNVKSEFEEAYASGQFKTLLEQKNWIYERLARRCVPGLLWGENELTPRKAQDRAKAYIPVPPWAVEDIARQLVQRGITAPTEEDIQRVYNAQLASRGVTAAPQEPKEAQEYDALEY